MQQWLKLKSPAQSASDTDSKQADIKDTQIGAGFQSKAPGICLFHHLYLNCSELQSIVSEGK
jgi:hypothetical protein